MNYEEEMKNKIIEEIDKPLGEEINRKVREEFLPKLGLMDFVTTVTEIKCDECDTIDKSYMDEWEAIESFIDRGWEVKNKKCLCEKCLEKLK